MVCPYVGIHRRMSFMSSSSLFQQWPVYFVYLGWFTRLEISGHTIAALLDATLRICLKQHIAFLSSFHLVFSSCFICIRMVHPYSSADTGTTWKKYHFILSDWSVFHMINKLSIAVLAFLMHMLTFHSVDEIFHEEYQTYFLQLSYIDCLYHNWQGKTSHILKLFLFVSNIKVFSSESLLSWFYEWKILLQKRSMPQSSRLQIYNVTWYPTETIEIRLILSSRWNEQWQTVKDTIKKECRSQRGYQQMLLLSNLRLPDTGREKEREAKWLAGTLKRKWHLLPVGEKNEKKNELFGRVRRRQNQKANYSGWRRQKHILDTRDPSSSSQY